MKRSEMLEMIVQSIINYELDYEQYNINNINIIAEYVLEAIEKQGMSPPLHPSEILPGIEFMYREWEEEDE